MKIATFLSLMILTLGALVGFHVREESRVVREQSAEIKKQLDVSLFPKSESSELVSKRVRGENTKLTNEDFTRLGGRERQSYLAEMARRDPRRAFSLIRKGDGAVDSSLLKALAQAGRTAEERTGILEAMRSEVGLDENTAQETLIGLARSHSDESFEAVKTWMEAAALTRKEQEQFATGLLYDNVKRDPARWMEWLGESISPRKIGGVVGDLMGQWTQQDYLAAGTWLATEPDGLVRTAAVRSYSVTVAFYEPQTAAQWALTLPLGKERDATLRQIYQSWPMHDAAGAAAFAVEHGIKR